MGKTTLSGALAAYHRILYPEIPLYYDSFTGSLQGRLGEWVYRFHRQGMAHDISVDDITPQALNLLHLAGHADSISRFAPLLSNGGNVIMDRYWWSVYVYERARVSPDELWPFVRAGRPFVNNLLAPTIVYLTRQSSLKPEQMGRARFSAFQGFYQEVIEVERAHDVSIYEISNDGALEETWDMLLAMLRLPHRQLQSVVQ